jgi:hypothetical protein
MADERLYDYTNQREKGDEHNLYWNNFSKQVTEAELKELFNAEDNGQLRKAFGSFDNYLAYMDERQDLINSGELKADWWDTGVALVDQGMMSEFESDMDDRAFEESIIGKGVELSTGAYADQAEVLNSLYSKYTGEDFIRYNSDGDKFEWNGTSFVKTVKIDDSVNTNALILGAMLTGVTAGAFSAAGLTGAGLGGALGKGAAAATSNALTQAALTGSVDARSALASGIMAGVSPGGLISNALDLVPDSALSGAIIGASNSAISGALQGTGFSLEDAALAGLQGGIVNILKDLYNDATQFDVGSRMEQIAYEREQQNLAPLSSDALYKAAMAMEGTGVSDLAGLVGKDGLIPGLDAVDTRLLTNLLGGAEYLPSVFIGPDGKTYTDVEIIEMGMDPADIYVATTNGQTVDGFVSGYTEQELTILGKAWEGVKDNVPGVQKFVNFVNNGLDSAARTQWINEYGFDPNDPNNLDAAKDVIIYGPVDETYTFSDNPRGDAEVIGQVFGEDDKYSTGPDWSQAFYELYEPDGTTSYIPYYQIIKGIQDGYEAGLSDEEIRANLVEQNIDPEEVIMPDGETTLGDAILQGILGGLPDDSDLLTDSVTDEEFVQDPLLPDELPGEEPPELPPELTTELPPELTTELPPELTTELPPELTTDLPPELPGGGVFVAGGKGQFTPFREGLSYQPVQPVSLIETPQKDYVAELNGELDKFFSRNMKKSMFEGMI